jgi:hypothetical protein
MKGSFVSTQCEGLLKNEYTKFQATHDKFCKDKAAHIQNFKGMADKDKQQPIVICDISCRLSLSMSCSSSIIIIVSSCACNAYAGLRIS